MIRGVIVLHGNEAVFDSWPGDLREGRKLEVGETSRTEINVQYILAIASKFVQTSLSK